nr:MAG TPA: hypothetical protein [Caudoviricetes sp.]
MYILIIKYRERGTYLNEHEETKAFSAKCEVYRYISAIDLRYYIISYSIYIKVEENGHTFIDNSK